MGCPAAGAQCIERVAASLSLTSAVVRSVNGESLDEVQGYWNNLAADATIVEPLAASAWSPGFGMLTDQFGVTWSFGVHAD